MLYADIVVLDSGVSWEHKALRHANIVPLYNIAHDKDLNGHGTAIVGIISKHVPNVKIMVGRVLDEYGVCETESLIQSLQYIYQNVSCRILHLSLGIREDADEVRDICKKISDKGVIIISAFDNSGGISYPAAYPFVIGVDASAKCKRMNDFVFVKNSIVNLKAKGGIQRLAWLDNAYVIAQGASFAAAYVSVHVLNTWEKTQGNRIKILKDFQAQARYIYDFPEVKVEKETQNLDFIYCAGAFPYNKEIEGIFNFQDMLNFQLKEVYDLKYSGHVGKTIMSLNEEHLTCVQCIDDLTSENIDTLIIGHLSELEAMLERPIKKMILEKCLEKGIHVFMFDSLEYENFAKKFHDARLYLRYAETSIAKEQVNKFGKLFTVSVPVLGIFGTSSKQGKFTLQMELRKRFLQDGYIVEQLGTEPSAPLFGMEAYPFGYGSKPQKENVGESMIELLNSALHSMEKRKPDIILVGSQSGTTPMLFDNLGQFPLEQIVFLLGTLPDGIILCVNYEEEKSYVKRTVQMIRGLSDATILAIAVYPRYYKNGWHFANGHQSMASVEQMNQYSKELYNDLHIPVFNLDDIDNYNKIYKHCIHIFTGEDK